MWLRVNSHYQRRAANHCPPSGPHPLGVMHEQLPNQFGQRTRGMRHIQVLNEVRSIRQVQLAAMCLRIHMLFVQCTCAGLNPACAWPLPNQQNCSVWLMPLDLKGLAR
jgi:hypothetical protein